MAETKFLQNPAAFIPHILNPNPEALDALITVASVEKALLERLKKKVAFYGQDLGPDGLPVENPTLRIDPEHIYSLYSDHIIRVTKDVEVCIAARFSWLAPVFYDPLGRLPIATSQWLLKRRNRRNDEEIDQTRFERRIMK